MKQFFKKELLFFILSLFSFKLFSNSIIDEYEKIYTNAKILQQNECYKEAATEFKRYIYFSDYAPLQNLMEANKELALYYKQNNQFKIAKDYISNAINILLHESPNSKELENLYKIDLEIIFLNSEKEKKWLIYDTQINSYINFNKYSDEIKQEAYKILIKSDIINWEWKIAESHFYELCNKYPELYSKETINKFSETVKKQEKEIYKNPTIAQILSVIPGLGQLYAQNYKDALNAFLLNGTIIAATCYSIYSKFYVDIIFAESPLLFRFYPGNLFNAKKEALIYNQNKNFEYENKLLSIIEESKNYIIEKNQ